MTEPLQLAQLGNPILRQQAQAIDNIQAEHIQQLIDALIATAVAASEGWDRCAASVSILSLVYRSVSSECQVPERPEAGTYSHDQPANHCSFS